MNFEQLINDNLKNAMKSGDKIRLETLRSLRASIIEFNKSGSDKEMTEDVAMKILNSAAKQRRDAMKLYEQGGRNDLAEKEKQELEIIREFLPEQMSGEEIKKIISGIISDTGASGMQDMGKVMGKAMQELKGKADGSAVKSIVQELLG